MDNNRKYDCKIEKKGKNLLSILDKLRHSVPDAGPSVIITRTSRENDDFMESSSARSMMSRSKGQIMKLVPQKEQRMLMFLLRRIT